MTLGLRTQLVAGEASPVLVKTPIDHHGRKTLAREADRLERARHPGVVELLERSDDRLVVAWAGGETLETLRPTVRSAAALLAAIAATVADLHEIGIVHGHLEARHVVVGPGGRPRLAGMAGRSPAEAEAAPADDVEAVGRLIDLLIGPDAELEPIPERRWARSRWSGYQRRALQTLADHATHEDPARRPTARGLAAAIAEAVPDAMLPDEGGAWGQARGRFAGAPRLPDGEGPVTVAEPDVVGPDMVGPDMVGPDMVGPEAVDHPWPTTRPSLRNAPGPTPSDPGTASEPEPGVDADAEPGQPAAPAPGQPRDHEAAADPGTGVDPGIEAEPRIEAESRTEAEPQTEAEPDPMPATAGVAASSRSDPPSEDDHPTILGLRIDASAEEPRIGPSRPGREPPTEEEPSRRSGRAARALIAGAAAVVVLMALTGWLRPEPVPPTTDAAVTADQPAPPSLTPDGPTAPDEPAVTEAPIPAPVCPRTSGASVDLNGDGCPERYRVDGVTIEAGGITYIVGETDDTVGVGDWNCDGIAAPGVVRPATGEVFLFDGWADRDEPVTVDAQYVVPGARSLAADDGATCEPPAVTLANGSVHALTDRDATR
ncbi:hypothetical protein BH20ACT3_BH20ACT3_08290 [soil metagenome]